MPNVQLIMSREQLDALILNLRCQQPSKGSVIGELLEELEALAKLEDMGAPSMPRRRVPLTAADYRRSGEG